MAVNTRSLLTMPMRLPRDLAGIVNELGAANEFRVLRGSPVFRGEGVRHGDGLPVLLLPGFLTSETSLRVMGVWLHRNGYRPYRFGRRPNVSCSEASVQRLERRIEDISAANDSRRVALVGHSRGGQFARVLSVRRPDLVSSVITLGMPSLDPAGASIVVLAPALATATLGTVGVRGFWGASCMLGACCAEFREQLSAPVPTSVAHVAIHSPQDGIVDYTRVAETDAERRTVRASHIGMIFNAEVYEEVAEILGDVGAAESAAVAPLRRAAQS